jgi:protein-S-isoprenylcysteine O-methyltransferase Ste14
MDRRHAVHASLGARRLDRRDGFRRRAGARRLGDRHYHQGFTRNPIYLGMCLGLVGLAIAFNSLWLLGALVPFALVIRYGVVAREEVYLERKFGDAYRHYRARVRRWL